MANETPNRVHAGGVFVPTETVDPPFTSRLLASQGIQTFTRVDVGQYLLTLQRTLAFSEGYAEGAVPANFQGVAGAQISDDGASVLLTVLSLGTGVPVDPPIVMCTVWSVREGEGPGPSLPFPAIPPPIPGGAGVTSWNSRTGAVVPVAGDYAASQITNDSSVPGADVAAALDELATRIVFSPAETNASQDNYRVRPLGASGNFNFNFPVPDDFGSLISIGLVGVPMADVVAGDIDLASDYGAVGESILNTQETDLTSTYNLTALDWNLLDLSSVFSALKAGDYCGVNVDHNGIGTTVDYIFARLEYAL